MKEQIGMTSTDMAHSQVRYESKKYAKQAGVELGQAQPQLC